MRLQFKKHPLRIFKKQKKKRINQSINQKQSSDTNEVKAHSPASWSQGF